MLPLRKKKDTSYGFAPIKTPTVTSFSTDEKVLSMQDIGLNGIDNIAEREKYSVEMYFPNTSSVYQDPAGDDYQYFRSSLWDTQKADILTRYTRFNNTQGNTSGSTHQKESYSVRSKGTADAMDYNRDGVLSTAENYSAFVVDLSPDSLLFAGKNHVTTIVRSLVKKADGTTDSVRWIEMRIPLSQPKYSVGTGLNSNALSAIRMYFSGVKKAVVLRMAVLELEKSEWKVFDNQVMTENRVSVGTVSVVKNSSRVPIPYIPPEKVKRERISSGMSTHFADESSLCFVAEKIPQGQIKGVYRDMQTDILLSERIKMFVHGEAVDNPSSLSDDDIDVVLRMGGDYTTNYYQVQHPLRPTQWGATASQDIWREENEIDIPTTSFSKVKIARDEKIKNGTHQDPYTPYTEKIDGYEITVCGYPSVAMIRGVMIGAKNKTSSPKSVCVWADELRVETTKKRTGWAADVSVGWNISSLAMFESSLGYYSDGMNSGRYSSLWYKTSVAVQLGQFLPEKWNVIMPFSFSIGKWEKTPVYAGESSDIRYEDADIAIQRFLKTSGTNKTLSVSLAFGRKEGFKAHIWDIQNFSLSYSLNTATMNDYYTAEYLLRSHNFSAGYNYINTKGFYFPFSKSKKCWLSQFNIKPIPSSLYFKVSAKRYDVSSSVRDFSAENAQGVFSFLSDYTTGYSAGFAFDMTKSFRVSFSASGIYEIDMPTPTSVQERKSALENVFSLGRTTAYNHRVQIGWRLPFHVFSDTDWIDVKIQYTSDFFWRSGSTLVAYNENAEQIHTGNTVQNASTFALTASMDFSKWLATAVKQDGTLSAVKNAKNKWGAKNILRRIDASYQQTKGTLLPGYMGGVGFMGMDAFGVLGWDFMMGRQTDALQKAFIRGQITTDGEYLATQYARKNNTNYPYGIEMELAPHLLVNLKGSKEENKSTLSSYSTQYDPITRSYSLNIGKNYVSGNINVSAWAFTSSFDKNDENSSETILRMRSIMPQVAQRLAQKYGITTLRSDGYPSGLPANHPEVLTYSFIGAYLGGKTGVSLDLFGKIPLPQISIEYTGLGYLSFLKNVFSSIKLCSKYNAWYSINDFSTNELWGSTFENDMYPQKYVFSSVNVVEAFSPLIGVEVSTKNSLKAFFSYTRDRMVSLNVGAARISQTTGRSFSFGGSVKIAKKWTVGSDVVLRKNYTTLFSICTDAHQVSAGEKYTSLRCYVDYSLGKNLTVGFNVYALIRGYMLAQMPSTFSTTGTFNVKYNIGE